MNLSFGQACILDILSGYRDGVDPWRITLDYWQRNSWAWFLYNGPSDLLGYVYRATRRLHKRGLIHRGGNGNEAIWTITEAGRAAIEPTNQPGVNA